MTEIWVRTRRERSTDLTSLPVLTMRIKFLEKAVRIRVFWGFGAIDVKVKARICTIVFILMQASVLISLIACALLYILKLGGPYHYFDGSAADISAVLNGLFVRDKIQSAPVVGAFQRINVYSLRNIYQKLLSYPLDSDLSSGYRYPPFKQLRPDIFPWPKESFFILPTFEEFWPPGYSCKHLLTTGKCGRWDSCQLVL